MSFDNAKRILQNSEARVSSSAEGIYDDDLVVLFWENIEAHYIDECIRYLNDTSVRALTGPTTFYDITFDDDLYHLHAYYNESDQRIYRVLMRSAATTSSITQSDTKWRLQSGETYQAGTSNLVLVIYNVDPNYIVSLESESLNETYTDSIYLIGGTQLTGTWFSVARESDFNSSTGLYDLRWYISRYNTKEYIFTNNNNYLGTVKFFKHHMTNDDIDDFEGNYYFDTSDIRTYYYSTNGTDIIRKNNESFTGSLPSTAKNIITAVPRRNVTYDQRPDRENGEIDISLELNYTYENTSTSESKLQEYTETKIIKRNASSVPSPGTPARGTIVSIESTPNDDDTFDFIQTTRVFEGLSASSGSSNAFRNETIAITNNDDTPLGTPGDPSDGTIIIHESEQLPNKLFRNVSRTITSRSDVGTVTDNTELSDAGAGGYTESIVKKYNQSSAESISESDTAAGKIVTVENNINEDGTYNTVKSIRTERQTSASSGSKGLLTSETITITNNAASAASQPSEPAVAGVTRINESEQLPNGLFRNTERVITAAANDGSTDVVERPTSSELIVRKYNQSGALNHNESEEADGKTIIIENNINADGTFNTVKRTITATEITNCIDKIESSKVNSGGFVETITRNYNTTTKAEIGATDKGVGKVVSVENILNEDGTFNTVKSIRQFRSQKAVSGLTNAFRSETVEIETNAGSQASAPADQADGTIKIHESEQLENGKFRNIKRTITARNDIGDVIDSTELSDEGASGYTETVTKKFNQSVQATISEDDTTAGKIVTVENDINEDGTFNTVKRVRTERSSSATGGSSNAFRSESVTITNNSSEPLGVPSDQSDGTIKIHESEQLPNGLYRNIERTITSRTDLASETEITELGVSSSAGFVESITKKYNQTSRAVIDPANREAGATLRVENTLNEDGTFDTFESVKLERQSQAEGGKTSAANSTIVIVTNNASEELGDPTPGFTLTITGNASSATGVYKLNPTLSRYERMDSNNNYDEQWSISRDFQQTGSNPDTFLHSWSLYDADTNTQYYFTSNYSTLASFKSAEKNPTDGTIANGSFSEKSEGLYHVTDNSIIQHESQQLENGLFRNIQTISTNINQEVTSESKFQTYTDTVEFNSASSTKVTPGNPAAGTQVTVENNLNEDGTFNTVKRTRVFNSQSATGGASTDAYTETVVIENNANAQLAAPTYEVGKIKTNESQPLLNGKFRNIQTIRTLQSQSYGTTNPDLNDISDSNFTFIFKYGFPHKTTTLVGIFKGSTLPSDSDIQGVFDANGREVVVKRISNAEVVNGKFNYYLYEDHYKAPQNDNDDWFFHGSTLTWQKTRESIANFVTDNAGNTSWQPIDASTGVGGPKFGRIEQATRRTKTTTVYRKYFVRRPTDSDLSNTGINSSNELTTAAANTLISTAYKIIQISQFLFAVEKTVTTLGSRVEDTDGRIGTTGADYTSPVTV